MLFYAVAIHDLGSSCLLWCGLWKAYDWQDQRREQGKGSGTVKHDESIANDVTGLNRVRCFGWG